MMNEYIKSIMDRDPAAKSKVGIILTYPGVKAIFFHRLANFFSKARFTLIARIVSIFKIFNWNRNTSSSKDWEKFFY